MNVTRLSSDFTGPLYFFTACLAILLKQSNSAADCLRPFISAIILEVQDLLINWQRDLGERGIDDYYFDPINLRVSSRSPNNRTRKDTAVLLAGGATGMLLGLYIEHKLGELVSSYFA